MMTTRTERLFQPVQLLQWLAHVCLQQHRTQQALTLLLAADALGAGDGRSLALLALAYQRSGQPALALRTLDRIALAEMQTPLNAAVHLIRSQSLLAMGRAGEAREAMLRYMELRCRFPDERKGRW